MPCNPPKNSSRMTASVLFLLNWPWRSLRIVILLAAISYLLSRERRLPQNRPMTSRWPSMPPCSMPSALFPRALPAHLNLLCNFLPDAVICSREIRDGSEWWLKSDLDGIDDAESIREIFISMIVMSNDWKMINRVVYLCFARGILWLDVPLIANCTGSP